MVVSTLGQRYPAKCGHGIADSRVLTALDHLTGSTGGLDGDLYGPEDDSPSMDGTADSGDTDGSAGSTSWLVGTAELFDTHTS